MPDIFKQFKKAPGISLCPSTPAGSLSRQGFATLKELATKSQALLLAGDLSANEETKQLIRQVVKEVSLPTILCYDSFNLLDEKSWDNRQLVLILEEQQLGQILKQRLKKAPSNPQQNLKLTLSQLELGSALIINDSKHCWLKSEEKLVATAWPQASLDQLALAISISTFFINNPQETWPSLVSAIWQSKLNLESPK